MDLGDPSPVGVSITVSINFLEPYDDGGSPVGSLHFPSDPYAVALPSAYTIYENGLYQDVSHFVVSNGGPTDFTMVASDVPEPTSLLLLGSGVLGLAGILRRRFGREPHQRPGWRCVILPRDRLAYMSGAMCV